MLDVSKLHVDEITLDVQDLHAHVALHAAIGNLVALDVGADVDIERVDLQLRGVDAQALLEVHLDRVYEILARTLTTIDRNPQLLENILRPVGELVSSVGHTVEETVPEVGRSLGHTVEKTVPEVGRTVGRTVEKTVPEVGRTVGRTVEETVPEVGRTVGRTVEETVPEVGRGVSRTAEKAAPELRGAAAQVTEETGAAVAKAAEPTAEAEKSVERGARVEHVEERMPVGPGVVEKTTDKEARGAAKSVPEREEKVEHEAAPEKVRVRVVRQVRDAARNARTAVARTVLRRRSRPTAAKAMKRKRKVREAER